MTTRFDNDLRIRAENEWQFEEEEEKNAGKRS